ncbi:HAD hydrolase family protein [Lachnospiraceae bacterium 46-15]
MIAFFSDLDNTLIFSYKHDIGEDKRCVEIYQGREVSYITERTYGLLKYAASRLLFVPVTTRTEEQYRRIEMGVGIPPYALVCNGGVLLIDGQEDAGWYRESVEMTADCRDELEKAAEILEMDKNRILEVRNIRKLFLFTKSECPEESVDRLKEKLDMSQMDVFRNGVKVYALPKALNKGAALRRLRERIKPEQAIAAGDSGFDLPMLAEADVGIAPQVLGKCYKLEGRIQLMEPDRVFSERLLEFVISSFL